MTPDDWEQVRARRVDWRDADLHDLRIRYAALLLDVTEHRRALNGLDVHDADRRLWSVLDEGRGHGLRNEPQVVGREGLEDGPTVRVEVSGAAPEGRRPVADDEGVESGGGPTGREA